MRDLQERGDDSWSSGVQSLWGREGCRKEGRGKQPWSCRHTVGFWLVWPRALGQNNSLMGSKLCIYTRGREKSRLVAAAEWQLGSALGSSPRIMTAPVGWMG